MIFLTKLYCIYRFLPPGSYINAYRVTPEKIAAIVFYTIGNPDVYARYFRWKDMYTFHRRRNLEGICELCEHLNDKRWVNDYRTYDTFRSWWYNGQQDAMCGSNVTNNVDYSLAVRKNWLWKLSWVCIEKQECVWILNIY